jgi:Xaa-Pro aminopeptidase
MVITLEPGIETVGGRIMVHEENIVITETGNRFLSPRADRDLTVLQ